MSEQYKKRLRSSTFENAEGSRGKKSSVVALACSPVATVARGSAAAPSPVAMAKPAATVAVTTPPGFMPLAPSPAATREIVAPSSAATTEPAATVAATSPVAAMAPAPATPSSEAIAKPAATVVVTTPVATSSAAIAKPVATEVVTSPVSAMAPACPVAIPRTVTVVKPEDLGAQATEAKQEDGAAVAVVAEEKERIALNLDLRKELFDCAACRCPLKPPVFRCEKEHFVCNACVGGGDDDGGAKKHCRPCGGDAAYTRSNLMDDVVDAYKVPCPYRSLGCARSTAYHSAAEHTARCKHAPCYCLECRFVGSPANLVRHLTAPSGEHSWPAEKIKYETCHPFTVPASSECQRPLLVAEDGRVFLLAVGAGREPAGSRTVHVVCVRGNADADATPLYTGVLWVEGPPTAPGQLLRSSFQLKATVASCSVPGAVDMEQGWLYAHVNPKMLHGESGEVHLRLCLTKFPVN